MIIVDDKVIQPKRVMKAWPGVPELTYCYLAGLATAGQFDWMGGQFTGKCGGDKSAAYCSYIERDGQ